MLLMQKSMNSGRSRYLLLTKMQALVLSEPAKSPLLMVLSLTSSRPSLRPRKVTSRPLSLLQKRTSPRSPSWPTLGCVKIAILSLSPTLISLLK
nr:MAG TPA: hypothetical protein [Caudoviricetes sp.]